MATTRRWRGFVFEKAARPVPDEGFNEWRCFTGPANNLQLLAWPIFNGTWYATITYLNDNWFSNGQGDDFRSALDSALREMKIQHRDAKARAKELEEALHETQDARDFYGAAVEVIEKGGKKKWT